MNGEAQQVEIDRSLESLDRWMDAFKDIIIVSFGLLASYATLASGGTIDVALMMIIFAGAVLSSIFLPYKIAVTKKSILGIFSRYRAIEVMIIIVLSWIIPTVLLLIFPSILNYLPPQDNTQGYTTLLLLVLPFISALAAGLFGQTAVLGVLRRLGITSVFFDTYEKYPWGIGATAPIVVSQTVISTQLYLVQASQLFEQSSELAISIIARSLGALIVLILLCCSLAYYEPKRVLTQKGEALFGIVGIGVFASLWNPIVGFVVSLFGVLLLIRYSLSLPPLDVMAMIEQEKKSSDDRKFNQTLLRIKYGRKAQILRYSRVLLLYLGIIGFMVLLILDWTAEYPTLFYLALAMFIVGFILFIFESTLRIRISAKKWGYIRLCVEKGETISAGGMLEYLEIDTGLIDSVVKSTPSEDVSRNSASE